MTAPVEAPAPAGRARGDLAGKDLTAREVEVLDLASHGWTSLQIAQRMNLTEATVRTHMARILAKLGATGREHAVRLGVEAGYLVVARARSPRTEARSGMSSASRRTLAGHLAYLEAEATRLPDTALGVAFRLHLAKAANDAAIQADEIAMLRLQAVDRERLRAVVQQITVLVDGFDPSQGGADLVLAAVRDVVRKAGSPAPVDTNPKEFQS